MITEKLFACISVSHSQLGRFYENNASYCCQSITSGQRSERLYKRKKSINNRSITLPICTNPSSPIRLITETINIRKRKVINCPSKKDVEVIATESSQGIGNQALSRYGGLQSCARSPFGEEGPAAATSVHTTPQRFQVKLVTSFRSNSRSQTHVPVPENINLFSSHEAHDVIDSELRFNRVTSSIGNGYYQELT